MMKTTASIKGLFVALVLTSSFTARANSIGLYIEGDGGGQLTIDVQYDFTEFAMFGGGANLVYDPTVMEFVSYTQADLPADAQFAASPVGQFEFPGLYSGFGIGTFEFFTGMNSAGSIGTFTFNFIGSSPNTDFAGCGGSSPHDYLTFEGLVCVTPNSINPFVSLAGNGVNEEIFTGPGAYIPPPDPVPLPGALWLFMSAVAVMAGLRKKSQFQQ